MYLPLLWGIRHRLYTALHLGSATPWGGSDEIRSADDNKEQPWWEGGIFLSSQLSFNTVISGIILSTQRYFQLIIQYRGAKCSSQFIVSVVPVENVGNTDSFSVSVTRSANEALSSSSRYQIKHSISAPEQWTILHELGLRHARGHPPPFLCAHNKSLKFSSKKMSHRYQ